MTAAGSRPAARPLLSVVVTVVDGGASLEACLEALREQSEVQDLEVLVPVDSTVRDVARTELRFPECHFVDLGTVETEFSVETEAGRHELYDRRRSVGLARASGEFVAVLEDRGVPRHDWASEALRAHEEPCAAVGGAVVNGVDHPRNWAVYFCDFGRYQPPLAAGPTARLTDVNVCYRREALEAIHDVWRERFHETTLHAALVGAGGVMRLAPGMIVEQQRRGLRARPMFAERYHWGRLYALARAREMGALRFVMGLLAPGLPVLLLARMLGRQLRRPTLDRFCRSLHWVIPLVVFWSLGEMMGYLGSSAVTGVSRREGP